MGVPRGARPGLKGDAGGGDKRRVRRLNKRVDADGSRKPVRRALAGRLRADAFDLHGLFLKSPRGGLSNGPVTLGRTRLIVNILALGPVSRILFHALRRFGRHFSRALSGPPGRPPRGGAARRRTGATYPRPWDGPSGLLFCLAPEGVFRAARLAECAVGSYPTFSPLPFVPGGPNGGLFSVTLSVGAAPSAPPALAFRLEQHPALRCPAFPLQTSIGRGVTRALGSKNLERRPGPRAKGPILPGRGAACKPLRFPEDHLPALVAEGELRVRGLPPGRRLDLARDLEVAAAALAAPYRHDGGHPAPGGLVIGLEGGRRDRRPRLRHGGHRRLQLLGKAHVPLPHVLYPGLVAHDVLLQGRLGRGKPLLRLVDRVHRLQLLPLKVVDLLLDILDLVPERLVLVVLFDQELLGLVFPPLRLSRADLGLQDLLPGLELAHLALCGVDGGLLGRD